MGSLEKEFYTVRELAELFCVKPLTIYRMVQRKELPFHKIGRSVRFRRDDIEEYLRTRRTPGTSEQPGE